MCSKRSKLNTSTHHDQIATINKISQKAFALFFDLFFMQSKACLPRDETIARANLGNKWDNKKHSPSTPFTSLELSKCQRFAVKIQAKEWTCLMNVVFQACARGSG